MIQFRTTGVELIVAEVKRREQAYNGGARRLMEGYSGRLENRTAQLAPYDFAEKQDTFHMRDELRTVKDQDGLGFETGWFEEDFAAAGFYPYYLVQEFGSVKQPSPQPSLTPAWAELEPSFLKDIEALGNVFSEA